MGKPRALYVAKHSRHAVMQTKKQQPCQPFVVSCTIRSTSSPEIWVKRADPALDFWRHETHSSQLLLR